MGTDSDIINWWQPQTGENEARLVQQVLESNFLNDGEFTTRFELKLSEILGCKHVVAVTSGTSALFLSLAGLGIGPGDEVIVPDVTFIATANAVTMTGARVVLADVVPETLNLCPAAFERAITPKTKAVIPVHVSGRPANMPAILKIAESHGIHVVEDAAEALLSKLNGKYLGTFGKSGIFSFSPNKTITTGQGGAVLTNDETLHFRLRELKDQGRPFRGTGGNDEHPRIGYNFKLTNLQAAIGLAQLEHLKDRVERLKRHYEIYQERLAHLDGISILPFKVGEGEVPQWVDSYVDRRDELEEFLSAQGAMCRKFWFPMHTHAPYRQSDELFPNSTRCVPRALWLPSAFTLTDDDIGKVCGLIRKFFGKN